MRQTTIYIDIKTSQLTLSQVMAAIPVLKVEHPDEEIFMDGDLYAIVGRKNKEIEEIDHTKIPEVFADLPDSGKGPLQGANAWVVSQKESEVCKVYASPTEASAEARELLCSGSSGIHIDRILIVRMGEEWFIEDEEVDA